MLICIFHAFARLNLERYSNLFKSLSPCTDMVIKVQIRQDQTRRHFLTILLLSHKDFLLIEKPIGHEFWW